MTHPRLAVLWDPPDEEWLSMDLAAEMLTLALQRDCANEVSTHRIQPDASRFFRRLRAGAAARRLNGDRLVTRFLKYPSLLLRARNRYDYFHVVDHSYAQLVHALPRARTGVFIHDLDAFECVLRPEAFPRPRWFRAMVKVMLAGLRKAAVAFTSTEVMAERVRSLGLVESGNIVLAPLGVAPEFLAADTSKLPASVRNQLRGRPFVLHVGSNIARKRLDILFQVFAELRRRHPELVLVQQGARFTPAQGELVARLGLKRSLVQPPRLTREELAALYRTAQLTLLPSDNEGFGFPIIEALASGSRVLASDLPTIREAGGEAITYCPIADVPAWVEQAFALLESSEAGPRPDARGRQMAKFTWKQHAETVWNAYASLGGQGTRA